VHKRLPLVALALLCSVPTALAQDWFDIDRSTVEARMRPVVMAAFPSADLKAATCDKPQSLRSCRYDLAKPFTVRIVETSGGKTDIGAFMGGAPGRVYEIGVELGTTNATQADWDRFTDLCAAAVSAVRGTPAEKSKALVGSLMTKAIKRHVDPAQARQADKASNVIIDYSHVSDSRCRVTAEDDYLPASGIYKASEDVP
jgi:ketosteroid isomerase-like protein